MKELYCCLLLVICADAGLTDDDLPKLARARYEAAEAAYRAAVLERTTNAMLDFPLQCLVITKLLRAQQDLHKNKEVETFKDHYERLVQFEQFLKKGAERFSKTQIATATSLRLEAKYWLEKAKAKRN